MSVQKAIKSIFNAPRKGETFELKSALSSQYPDERKEGIKRVIKAMTVGKDVSALFPDVLKNIATRDLEQKKLVYLYLMNYAKTNPELCILAVNTFVQDTEDPNPLVRALAIRTMGCIRVQKMTDYMQIPLQRTLSDDNPYVRKTAAICVAKLYELNSEMCIEQGFLDHLKKLIDDNNPAVVSNCINALSEINQINPDENALRIDSALLKKILLALNECTEWGRITILTALSEYKSQDPQEALHIIERVVPQLQHANPSVVLSSIKTILAHVELLDTQQQAVTMKKLSAPLVSLVSASPEIQFISLRNIRIILEKYPTLLSKELRIFYIKYNDPLYLKLEKLEIMVRLATQQNYKVLLNELKEYAMEIDYEFVKRSVVAIGQVAIKLGETATERGAEILVDLISTRNEYVLNDVVIVMKDMIRKYSGSRNLLIKIVPVLILHWEKLDDSNAISSFVWFLGEYPQYFNTSLDPILAKVYGEELDNYFSSDDEYQVQLQLLLSIVKISLLKPSSSVSTYLQKTLTTCTENFDNADIRDRAFIYWRLLSSSNNELIKKIVLKQLPKIETTIPKIPQEKVDQLIAELGTLSSIYHEPSSTFMEKHAARTYRAAQDSSISNKNLEELQQIAKNEIVNKTVKSETLLDLDGDTDVTAPAAPTASSGNVLDELNDLFNFSQPAKPATSTNQDIMGLFGAPQQANEVGSIGTIGTSGVANGLANLSLGSSNGNSNGNGNAQKKTNDDLLGLFG